MTSMQASSETTPDGRSATSTPYVRVSGVSKSYDHGENPAVVLKEVTLNIAPGEFISIVGPSGCGKSTLLKCIAGLQPVTAGRIMVKDEHVLAPPDNMTIVFQRDVLLDWRTVLDTVLLMVEFKGLKRKDYEARALQLLTPYHLAPFLHPPPCALSAGIRHPPPTPP